MIRILFGAGTPAVNDCLTEQIKQSLEQNMDVVLLVPEQQTVSCERRMVRTLPGSAQLHFEVQNFSRLANRVARSVGGLCQNEVNPAAEMLLLYRTMGEISELLVQYDEKTTKNNRFCEKLLATKASLFSSLATPEKLLKAVEGLPAEDRFSQKMTDLGNIFAAHELLLDTYYGKHRDALAKLPLVLKEHGKALFSNTCFFIDSFSDFTSQELEILAELIRVSPVVTITSPLSSPHDEGLHLLCACRTLKKLRGIAARLGVEVLVKSVEQERCGDAFSYLRRNLFNPAAEPAPLSFAQENNISITRCKTPLAEAEFAAYVIHNLVRNGARYKDIAVITRDANAYAGILDATLEKAGIPFFFSEKTDLSAKPLLKLILSALSILRFGFRAQDIIAYLKSGLTDVANDEISFFEEYLRVWRFRGKAAWCAPFTKNADGLSTEQSARGNRILAIAESVRQQTMPAILTFADAFGAATDVKGQILALFSLLQELHVAEKLKRRAAEHLRAGERKEAEEQARLFSVTAAVLEDAAKLLGDTPRSAEDLQNALLLALGQTEIGTIPTSADEVTIGSASMLRADHPKYVIAIGLVEGGFPRNVKDDGLIDRLDQARLFELGIELPGDHDANSSNELFFVWRAFTAPTKRLWLSYHAVTLAGKVTVPSYAISRVHALFPTISTERFEDIPPMERLFSPVLVGEHLAEFPAEVRDEVCALIRSRCPDHAAISNQTARDLPISVPTDLANDLFDQRELSPSQLESFARCRFAYYCSYILSLREDPSDLFDSRKTGTYIHAMLEHAIAYLKERPEGDTIPEEEIDTLLKTASLRYRSILKENVGELSARAQSLLERMELLAGVVVRGLFEEFADSDFRPGFLEFNPRALGASPRVFLPDGSSVPLTGRADRVDFWYDGKKNCYFRVVDYKSSPHSFDPTLLARGGAMQMPLYLFALCKNRLPDLAKVLGLPKDTAFLPAGITYLSFGIGSEKTPHICEKEQALLSAITRIERKGVLRKDPTVLKALSNRMDTRIIGTYPPTARSAAPFLDDDGFEKIFSDLSCAVGGIIASMREGKADAGPRVCVGSIPCQYCKFSAICRAKKS